MQHRTPPRACPACKVSHDAASNLGAEQREAPAPGDYAICSECGAMSVFEDASTLRLPTAAELTAYFSQMAAHWRTRKN